MKLAEALALRADLTKRIASLRERATACARYQEGEEPQENAEELLNLALALTEQQETLITRINRTNGATEMDGGSFTIMDAVARRDRLGAQHKLLTEIADAAAGGKSRAYYLRQLRSELKEISNVPVTALRGQADLLAQQRRELDVRIQQANWNTDLLD
jgi:Family of unknown function (DUF6847)